MADLQEAKALRNIETGPTHATKGASRPDQLCLVPSSYKAFLLFAARNAFALVGVVIRKCVRVPIRLGKTGQLEVACRALPALATISSNLTFAIGRRPLA